MFNVSLVSTNTDDPIRLITDIASVCYDSQPKDPEKFIKHLYMSGHLSAFEFVDYTFKLEHISRAAANQMVRHRECSFMQRSQRHCDESGFGYVLPDEINWIQKFELCSAMDEIQRCYKRLVDLGMKVEDARSVLPNACQTILFVKCNLRELIHIANERLCMRAQREIRDIVSAMCNLVHQSVKFALVPKCESGILICNTPCFKKGQNVE